MILSDIRQYMKNRGRASLDDLVVHFEGDKTAIEGMMETLKSRRLVIELGCGGCSGASGCLVSGPKIYAYVATSPLKKLDNGSSICGSQS
jgi:hypothetical protein